MTTSVLPTSSIILLSSGHTYEFRFPLRGATDDFWLPTEKCAGYLIRDLRWPSPHRYFVIFLAAVTASLVRKVRAALLATAIGPAAVVGLQPVLAGLRCAPLEVSHGPPGGPAW